MKKVKFPVVEKNENLDKFCQELTILFLKRFGKIIESEEIKSNYDALFILFNPILNILLNSFLEFHNNLSKKVTEKEFLTELFSEFQSYIKGGLNEYFEKVDIKIYKH